MLVNLPTKPRNFGKNKVIILGMIANYCDCVLGHMISTRLYLDLQFCCTNLFRSVFVQHFSKCSKKCLLL